MPMEQVPHHNDLFETRAIKAAFGDAAYRVPVSSTKSMIGHLLGAAGAVEFITCVKSIQDRYIHPTVGLKNPDEECDLNYVPGQEFMGCDPGDFQFPWIRRSQCNAGGEKV